MGQIADATWSKVLLFCLFESQLCTQMILVIGRQRHSDSHAVRPQEGSIHVQYAELEPEPEHSVSVLSTILIVILLIGIILLLLWRVYLQRMWKMSF